MRLFQDLFKPQVRRGILDGKTQEEKNVYFEWLAGISNAGDSEFFEKQYKLLNQSEQNEFAEWVFAKNKSLRQIRDLVNVIEKLLTQR